MTFKEIFSSLPYFQSHRPILCLSLRHKCPHCLNAIWRHGLCRGLCSLTSGLEMLKPQVWVKGLVQLHFIVTIKVRIRAPRKTYNNQQTHNYFVMFLVTNSFIKNSHTLYAGKNKYSSSLKIFSWCSNDKHWHNIPGKISLYSTYNLVYFDHRISTSCIFTNVKCLIRTKFSCRHGLLLIVAGKSLLSTQISLVAD